jgi:hypothetical protein
MAPNSSIQQYAESEPAKSFGPAATIDGWHFTHHPDVSDLPA